MSEPRFTAETNLQQALDRAPEVREAFKALGLKCGDCVAAEIETLRHAALYHEKPLEQILGDLNGLKYKEAPDAKSGS